MVDDLEVDTVLEGLRDEEEVEVAVEVAAGVGSLSTDPGDGDGPGVNAVPMVASPVTPHATAMVLPAAVSAYSTARRAMITVSTGLDASVGQVAMPLQLARSPTTSDKGASASMQKYV